MVEENERKDSTEFKENYEGGWLNIVYMQLLIYSLLIVHFPAERQRGSRPNKIPN
jgi:hypothetical protein